ncbi:kinase-like protein [Marasmius fiardii PR-910]|nr:kinase-like protein [Marasmius fiardii PR-910]
MDMWSEPDKAFDAICNMWRVWMRCNADVSKRGANLRDITSKHTFCMCLKNGQHPNVTVVDAVLLGTPEEIHNQMFMSEFTKDFFCDEFQTRDIQVSHWTPIFVNAQQGLLVRTTNYCYGDIRDEVVHYDLDDYISVVSTETSKGAGTSIRRTCIMWESVGSSRVVITISVEEPYTLRPDDLIAIQSGFYGRLISALSIHLRDKVMPKDIDMEDNKTIPKDIDIETANDIRALLSLETALDTLFALEPSKIPLILDLLQAEVKTSLNSEYCRKCMKFLRLLVNKYHILPPSLFVQEVIMEGSRILAVGGYSDIYKGIYKSKSVCLKVLRMYVEEGGEKRNKTLREFYKETLLWTHLHHPNLLPFLGVNTTLFPGKLALVAPWMANGQITKFLEVKPSHDKLRVISEIAAGIVYLHSRNIIHGDIKGANVLVDEQGKCYLADFGLATAAMTSTLLGSSTSGVGKGTTRWMAPEIFTSEGNQVENDATDFSDHNYPENQKPDQVKLARDIYAFACTVYEIIAGKIPFTHLNDAQVMFKVLNGERPKHPDEAGWCPDNIWALVQQCWAQKSHLRPTAVVVHAFLIHLERLRGEGLPWENEFPETHRRMEK